MEMGRSWQELGVVDTIYEDDHEEEEDDEEEEGETEDCFNSLTMSSSAPTSASCSPAAAPSASASLPPVLRNAVREWSQANGSCKPDVILRVQEHCFPLHRDQKETERLVSCTSSSSRISFSKEEIASKYIYGKSIRALLDTCTRMTAHEAGVHAHVIRRFL